ncbi:hypothetical protein H9L13_12235 [Sphingomonas lutea]|uniref:Uncharacterized protein n=1 Tax=Sphingomonas lutea TaxID=1045317 RepID=A0A7G9SHM8_9SPHN|nr:hypothetical protein [Sphingomonas lutea]QNN67353.1 hypothetical protein H9L13_12235 [Sphingomonas lutea]
MSPLWSDMAIAQAARAAAVERGVVPAATADTSKRPANDNRTGQPGRPAPRRPIRRYAPSYAL